MKTFEYVLSALAHLGATVDHIIDSPLVDEYGKRISSCTQLVKQDLKKNCKNINPQFSGLYNAFTENGLISRFKKINNLGFENFYADSGGLQIVTAGKIIDEEMKKKIYKHQTYADYAMCFDVIPLESISLVRTNNERTKTGNKIFNQHHHKESGHLTGINIKKQCEYFKSVDAKTKVIIIVQGNKADDMLLYFNEISKVLSDEDYLNIGGMAVADTCMGNGELESIEMIKAARQITRDCHPNIKQHLHLLGVGSISRIKPVVYLTKSGYLDTFDKISYDSSTHAASYDYGRVRLNNSVTEIGKTKTYHALKYYKDVYRFFEPVLGDLVTYDELMSIIFAKSTDWRFTTVKKNLLKETEERKIISGFLAKIIYIYYQIHNFNLCIDDLFNDKIYGDPISYLRKVKDVSDMDQWNKEFYSYVDSTRILRRENVTTLMDMFE